MRVGDVLPTLPGLGEAVTEARLRAAWPQLAGPAAARSRPVRLLGGCLHVAVDSSAWLHRLSLEEAALLARCQALGGVRALRFHLADPRGGAAP